MSAGVRCQARVPSPEIDAARVEARRACETLGHAQRRMVRQHDAARPDTQRVVCDAMCSIRISGDELAMLAMP
jgi:hypothetical protein